jgi:hypothetical protein
MTDFEVKRDDLRETRLVESEPPRPERGQAVLRVDSFGLTANNVTYAVFGELMSYWDFFPAADGWGRVPMWGFAEVAESAHDGVEAGMRVFGYLPPSSHLLVTPDRASERGFVDASVHRVKLPSAYHGYLGTTTDPFYDARNEGLQMILRPLFYTSFLIDDQLEDDGLLAAGPVVVSSASSKTAIAAAFLLSRRPGVEVVGLTSERGREFAESLGIYGRVVTYDAIGSLDSAPATFVDVAGDGEVRSAVHRHYGENLARSIAVGVTHWEDFGGGAGELPGPTPSFFFAPDRMTKRAEDWGRAGLESRVADVWHPFVEWTAGWLQLVPGEGFDAVQRVYLEVLEGRVDPATAHVLSV